MKLDRDRGSSYLLMMSESFFLYEILYLFLFFSPYSALVFYLISTLMNYSVCMTKTRKKPLDYELQGTVIPRLWTLRRIPERYRHLLPVAVMKRYQCMVVGGERGILTVAITEQKNICILHMLSALTGCTIFPVLIDPARMRLLIRRVERLEYAYYAMNSLALYSALQQRSMLVFLLSRYPGYFER